MAVTIISKDTKDEASQKTLAMVTDRYVYSQGFWQQRNNHNRVLMRDFRMELKLKRDDTTGKVKWPYRSKIVPPHAFEKNEIVVSQIKEAIFAKDPFYSVNRRRGRQDEGDLRKTDALLSFQLRQRNFRGEMDEAIQEAVLLGTKILRLGWVYEAEWITKRKAIIEFGVPMGVDEKKVLEEVYEGPGIEQVASYNFFLDPATPPGKLQDADYVIEEIVQPWWKFKADAESLKYDNIEDVEKLTGKWHSVQTGNDGRALPQDAHAKHVKKLIFHDHDRLIHVAVNCASSITGGVILKECPIHEIHEDGKYPYHALQTRIAVDEGVAIGDDEPNPYPVGSFYPFGTLHITHSLQQAITTMINQRIDMVTLGIQPPILLNGVALEDEGELAMGFQPAQMIHLANEVGLPINEVMKQVEIHDFYGQSYAHLLDSFLDMFIGATGASDIIGGKADSANATATGTLQLTSNAVRRFNSQVSVLVKRGIEPLLMAWINLNARLMDANTMTYVTGKNDPVFVNPEDIIRGASVTIRTAPYYSKRLQQDNLLKLAPILQQMNPFINLNALSKAILKNDEFIDDVSLILDDSIPDFTPIDLMNIQKLLELRQQMKMAQMGLMGTPQAGGGMPQMQGAHGVTGESGNVPNFDAAAEVNSTKALLAGNRT